MYKSLLCIMKNANGTLCTINILLCNDLEMRHNGMGRWLWNVGNVKNELIRGETGFSTFEEREENAMVKYILRVVFKEILMSDMGRECLFETGCKSM